jgi:hypothetical protein
MSENRKWSWAEFFIGLINKNLLVWMVSTYFVVDILHRANGEKNSIFYWILAGGWILLSIIFMLAKSIGTAVENAKINLELKAQANASADVAQMIKAFKEGENEKK